MRIGYVVSRFPKTTETFIAREAQVVVDGGHEVTMIAINRETDQIVQPAAAALLPNLIAGTDSPKTALLAAQLRWLRRRPARLARMWARGLLGNLRSPRFLTRALVTSLIAPWVADRIAEHRIEYLHAHWATHSALLAYQVSMLTDLPYSVTLHAHDMYVDTTMLGEKLRAAESIATISHYNADLLNGAYPDVASRISIVRCGVDTAGIDYRLTEPDNDPPRVVTVAGLSDYKGHAFLLEAQRLLAARGRAIHLDLVGDGELRDQLENLAAEVEGLSITFHGALPVDEAMAIVARSDVFVMPSVVTRSGKRDGVPVALMEAMALGVPVVSTRVSGIPELVRHGENGLLAEERDPVGLADAIERLLDDDVLRRRLRQAARDHVIGEFDINRSGQGMLELFDRYAARSVPAGDRR
jgi:glycosyltransferase involved in cell wall biosynthesis